MLKNNGYLVYTISGASMQPLLYENRDVVEIRPLNGCRPKKYDVVLYRSGDKYILHRILKVRSEDFIICGDHNFQREYGIADDQILGVMMQIIRNGKPVNIRTNILYGIYSHLWVDFYHIRAAILYSKSIIRRILRKIISLSKI